jgi:hypothetical protein
VPHLGHLPLSLRDAHCFSRLQRFGGLTCGVDASSPLSPIASLPILAQERVRIRFPLVFHNTGAVPIVIQNLRIKFRDESGSAPLPWVASRSHIRPESDDGHAFPAVFSVAGRTAYQTFQEFGASSFGFTLDAKDYRLRLEAKLGHKKKWRRILNFTLRAWRISDPDQFITYDNTPGVVSKDKQRETKIALDFAQMGASRQKLSEDKEAPQSSEMESKGTTGRLRSVRNVRDRIRGASSRAVQWLRRD